MNQELRVLAGNPQTFEISSICLNLLRIDGPTGEAISHTARNLSSGSYG